MQVIKASSATGLQGQMQGSNQQGISFLQQFLQSGIRQNLTEVTSKYCDEVKGMGYICPLPSANTYQHVTAKLATVDSNILKEYSYIL